MTTDEIWRLIRTKHVVSALTGQGAAVEGARWNRERTPAIYTSAQAATTVLETLAHMTPSQTRESYTLLRLRYTGSTVELTLGDLPSGWDKRDDPSAAQDAAAPFFEQLQAGGLIVPCVFLPEVRNFIFNPLHPGVNPSTLTIVSQRIYNFDPRWPYPP